MYSVYVIQLYRLTLLFRENPQRFFSRFLHSSHNHNKCGYNCIHLTPLQQVGSSGSCFSIHDFLNINSRLTEGLQPISYDRQEEFESFLSHLHYITPEGVHTMLLFHIETTSFDSCILSSIFPEEVSYVVSHRYCSKPY